MLCAVCRGCGSVMGFPKGVPEWWLCPCCGGAGVSVQHGPSEFRRRPVKTKESRP